MTVSVSDEGLGIPSRGAAARVREVLPRPSAARPREVGGTGLGLALAHEIVVAHGGRMGFESIEGHGSRFWFELPPNRHDSASIVCQKAHMCSLRPMLPLACSA